jgi:HEAT repeat protein
LLESSIFRSSARVRDGAALGLAFLDDPHAIPYLKRAIENEKYSELREDMQMVLAQLERSRK